MRWLSRRRQRRDAGAIAMVVTLLVASGAVIGSAALTVDIGQSMAERRELQNGADAAALSLAKTCALSPTSCSATGGAAGGAAGGTTALNNINARDKLHGFDTTVYPAGLCGVNAGPSLPSCLPPTGSLKDCPPVPSSLTAVPGIPFVEAHTITTTSAGHLLPAIFGQTITGTSGASVRACSRAAWGAPASATAGMPITVSACDWMHATNGTTAGTGGAYYPPPVYNVAGGSVKGYGGVGQPAWPSAAATPPLQLPGREVILLVQNPPGGATPATPCPSWQGHALPGGFGIVETMGDPCTLRTFPADWMRTDPGNSTGCDLSTRVGKVVFLPVFDCTASGLPTSPPPVPGQDCTQGNGSSATYHRQGYAAFYLSGYNVTTTGSAPNKVKSLVSGSFPCTGGNSCISGWFVSDSLTATAISGPPKFGTFAVLPAG